MGMMAAFEQISLFDAMMPDTVAAIWCFDGAESSARKPAPWEKRLVPDGEYVVEVGDHPLVLRPTKLGRNDIPQGHQFYHYLIGQTLYAGIFVGRESDG